MTLVPFEHIPIDECGEPLVDLMGYAFILEPAYFRVGLSDSPRLYARQQVADKLAVLQEALKPLRFKIWDPWRSRVVQGNIYHRFWKTFSEQHPEWDEVRLKREVEIYCTTPDNPNRIPPHSTGGAIDLTLINQHGVELAMGTGFDHLGPESASLYYEEPGRDPKVRDNRRMLREAMLSADFRVDDDEWWHFDFGNQIWAAAKGYPVALYGEKQMAP